MHSASAIFVLGERSYWVWANGKLIFDEIYVKNYEEVSDEEISMRLAQVKERFAQWFTADRRREVEDEYQRQRAKRKAEYDQFMQSEEWQDIRTVMLDIYNHQCDVCGATEDLQVHHLTYERFGGDERTTDLQVLCKPCHEKAHGRKF